MFGQPKGLSAGEFRKFNAPTVLLLDVPRRNWWSGETAEMNFVVSRFEDAPSGDATLRWRLHNGDEAIAQGEQSHLAIRSGEVQELPTIKLELPSLARSLEADDQRRARRRKRQGREFVEPVGVSSRASR